MMSQFWPIRSVRQAMGLAWIVLLLGLFAMVAFGMPAFAQGCTGTDCSSPGSATAIPEPDNLALLALGIIGLVIGRYAAKWRRDED